MVRRDGGDTGPTDALLAPDGPGTTCATDADCSDGNACNGMERCSSGRCAVAAPVDCDDDVGCTVDSCDEGTGACTNTIDDTRCTTGLICDRIDGCTTPRACTDDAGCDDGVFCNGMERCDLAFGCRSGSAPTCDDGIACTMDVCDATTDACTSAPDDTRCADPLLCNGDEVCAPTDPGADGEGCAAGVAVVCDDSVPCTTDTCDEGAAGCVSTPTDAMCDDGVFCNGAEACDPTRGGCQAGTTPACADSIPCTVGRCDAATDACVQDANPAACNDGVVCNGTERCDTTGTTGGTGCVSGVSVNCSDGMACTSDACTEPGGMCTHGGADADGDGHMIAGCAVGDDCDDTNSRIFPGATELCDGIDNNCSGGLDDGSGMECALGSSPTACTTTCGTGGTRPCNGACRFGTCVAATETCNNCDDDGDGAIDEPGGGSPVQCRSGDTRSCATTCGDGPGPSGVQTCSSGCAWGPCIATELCNGCDDDGDLMVDDGFTLGGTCTVGVGECSRSGTVVCRSDQLGTACSATPAAPVAELCNARDDDCDGRTDEAFTELGSPCMVGVGACRRTGGFICRTDGATTTCSASPGMAGTESCNSIDDDCDGTVDDGADGGPCDGGDGDLCQEGVNRCTAGVLVCDDGTGTITEACNMVDDNCNGTTDEGCSCTLGMMRSCYTGPAGTQGVGVCRAGNQTCIPGPGGVGSEWGTCAGVVLPSAETCNGLDDNCDNTPDNGIPMGAACDGTSDTDLCVEGFLVCSGGTMVCSDMTSSTVETCNGANDDCDANIDEGIPAGAACDGGDGDACPEGNFVCSGGTTVCNDTTGTSVETCNNVDDNCNGTVDEGNPGGGMACDGTDSDLCPTGAFQCTAGALICNDDATSTPEICGNGSDDDCNASTSDVCAGPVNDTCSAPTVLSGAGGSRMDTLVGATVNASAGCPTASAAGPDVYYSVTVSAPSVIWISTIAGTAFDTVISYRGTTCAGGVVQCQDDPCTFAGPAQIAQFVNAGTHYFAVAAYSAATTVGPVGITYGVFAAAGGTNTLIDPTPGVGVTATYSSAAATGTSLVSGGCITSAAPENSYYWLQCPAVSRSYTATMCGLASWDSVLYVRYNGAQFGCNDDFCASRGASRFAGATSSGAGVVQLFVDGFVGAPSVPSGPYSVQVTF